MWVSLITNYVKYLVVYREFFMAGSRCLNNYCYKLLIPITSYKTAFAEIEIWYQKLGHVNCQSLKEVNSVEGNIRGVSTLG